jgi:predicted TIM-barrel fold metal-dependent hydrolase
MIIDGHAHACGDYLTADSIINNLNDSGVDKVVLVPGELQSSTTYSLPNLAEIFPKKNVVKIFNPITRLTIRLTGAINQIPQGNDYVHDLAIKSQNRVLQFVWITTKIPDPMDYLIQKQADWKFKGVKMHQCWENFSVDSDFFISVAEWSEQNNIPLFIHLWSDSEVNKIIQYIKQHNCLKLIIAHLFGLELFIKNNCRDANLFFDISTLQVTSTHRVLKAIEFFGAEKILLGTDTPYGKNNLRRNIDRIRSLKIGEQEKNMILGKNMKDLLDL